MRLARTALLCCVLGMLAPRARAEWMNTTEPVPVDRVVENLRKRLDATPDDARLHGILARVHSLAWAHGSKQLHLEPPKTEGGLPGFAPYDTIKVGRSPRGPKPDTAAIGHYHKSVVHYRRAVTLAPDEALYRLGLAWMLDNGSAWIVALRTPDGAEIESAVPQEERAKYAALLARAAEGAGRREAEAALVEALPRPECVLVAALDDAERTADEKAAAVRVLRHHWLDLALVHYRRAHELALPGDRRQKSFGPRAEDAISVEAGEAILRILKERPRTDATRKEIKTVEKTLGGLAEHPRWITPIVFPTRAPATLRSLLRGGREVRFDLDGDGRKGRWPWPGPETGILVWQPDPALPITSGRQLFGSVTWGMFWRDGYEPLAALDDDGDGALRGAELEGIAVWRDADGDGEQDAGEVVAACTLGVRSIRTRATGLHAGVPANDRGLEMRDGTVLPTYDWTPERLPEVSARP